MCSLWFMFYMSKHISHWFHYDIQFSNDMLPESVGVIIHCWFSCREKSQVQQVYTMHAGHFLKPQGAATFTVLSLCHCSSPDTFDFSQNRAYDVLVAVAVEAHLTSSCLWWNHQVYTPEALVAKAWRLPIWLRPLCMWLMWISTLFWKTL